MTTAKASMGKPTIITWELHDGEFPALFRYTCPACGVVVSNVDLGDPICPKHGAVMERNGTLDLNSNDILY